jgi:dihydroflavonol-4-reductase
MLTAVTGASGFLGGVLVRALLAEGRAVRAVDLVQGPTLEGLDIDFVAADVLEKTSLETALDGAEVVYHLAAVISVTGDPTGRVWAINVSGARNVAETALAVGARRLVHCSSVHAYDLEAGVEIDEVSARAVEPDLPVYDRSKAAGEAAVRKVIDRGLDAVIVNPTGIIGPYDFAPSRMGQVLLALFEGRLPALIDGGFDWVDVRDVASSMIAAESDGTTGENYLLPGHRQSIRELAAIAEQVSGVPAPRITAPMWLVSLLAPMATVMSRRTGSALWSTTEALHALENSPPISGDKAADVLGHKPRPTQATVASLYDWFVETAALSQPR